MAALLNILMGFGLASAAGLNAYIPLVIAGVFQRMGLLGLSAPYDALGDTWVLAVLGVLLLFEIVVDKVPGADHINDVIQTVVRPAAGALVFAASTGVIKEMHPALAIVLGVVIAGGVHGAKAGARPVVNVATLGIGAPIVSVLEDLIALVLSVLAIVAPLLVVAFMAVVGYVCIRMYRGLRRRWQARQANAASPAVTVNAVAMGDAV